MNITIEWAVAPTEELRELIAGLNAVLDAAYEPHQRHGLAIAELFGPDIRFFLARRDGVACGCGGVALGRDYAEVKRVFTRAEARGRGVAQALLARIEDEARSGGRPVLYVETGIHQREAIGLYRKAGFRRCGPFGPYAAMPLERIETSVFFAKALGPGAERGPAP